MESILTSIKKLLGPDGEYEHFDPDIIMHINSALMELTQIGVGPKEGFVICDDVPTWVDFLGDTKKLESVKTYVYIQVKLVFDPPASSAVIEALKEQARRLEWRLNVAVDTPEE